MCSSRERKGGEESGQVLHGPLEWSCHMPLLVGVRAAAPTDRCLPVSCLPHLGGPDSKGQRRPSRVSPIDRPEGGRRIVLRPSLITPIVSSDSLLRERARIPHRTAVPKSRLGVQKPAHTHTHHTWTHSFDGHLQGHSGD